jgi:hypothetical protein
MLELVMRPFNPSQNPTIRFQLLDKLFAIHSGYCTHQIKKINTTTTVIFFFGAST